MRERERAREREREREAETEIEVGRLARQINRQTDRDREIY